MRKAMLAVRSHRRIGIGRAEAMAYRDARRQAMTEADWSSIETRLRRAYRSQTSRRLTQESIPSGAMDAARAARP
jgi:hypothetical protein